MPQITTPLTAGAINYSANCYVSLAEADAYFGDRLSGRFWVAQDNDLRAMALIEATSQIEHLLAGQDGDKYDSVTTTARPKGQPLQFPRSWDRENSTGTLVVDPNLKEGTYLLALHLLKVELGAAGVVDGAEMERLGLGSSGGDGVSASVQFIRWSQWPREVRNLISPFWKRQGDTVEASPEQRRWTQGWVAQ